MTVVEKERFWSKVQKARGCWTWTAACSRAGYGHLWVRGKCLLAHRVSWALHNGPIPPGLHVLHHCDNPPCIRPTHLFLGTPIDNMRDCAMKGRATKATGERNGMHTYPESRPKGERHGTHTHPESRVIGERNGRAKITEEHVREVWTLSQRGYLQREIAERYGISQVQVSSILTGKSWAHVDLRAMTRHHEAKERR